MKIIRLALLFLLLGLGHAFAGSVSWSAAEDNSPTAGPNGIADAFGTKLPAGDLVLIGTFNISDATIQANSGNIAFLMSHFATYGSTTIGSGVDGEPGYFYQNTVNNPDTTNPFPVAGLRIYIWAFNSPSATTATEQGIFTQTALDNWIFPHENGIPNTTSVDLSNLTDANGTSLVNGADIVVGGFRQGALNTMDFNLALIPEPSTYALALAGGALLLFVRRKRSPAARR